MRLIVVMNVFNEARNIAKAIESVHDVADEIWIYDGAYKEYPHDNIHSTDGTIEIAKQYKKVKVFQIDKAWENQLVKRTAMFDGGKKGDYFFKLDGDEYVTNPERIREYMNKDVGLGWTVSNLYDKPVMITRLFKYRKGMHYAGRHHWLFDGDNTFITSDQNINPKYSYEYTDIRVVNFRDSSSSERRDDKKQFLRNRVSYEGKYQKEDEVYPNKKVELVPHEHRDGRPNENTMVIRECKNPEYTMSLMFSRRWALRRYFKHLKRMEIPEHTEVVCVVDTLDIDTRQKVVDKLSQSDKFEGVKIIFTGKEKIAEFQNVSLRRQRIVDNWNMILAEARGKIMLGSEDDSLPQYDAYTKLLETMKREKADFVQGNIIGRWYCKMCPAWKVLEKKGEPALVYNAAEKRDGVEEIQGVGWYCFVTPVDLMRKYPMELDNILPLGPDLRFGYQLHKNGYKIMHDWGVHVEHFGEDFRLIIGDERTEQRLWRKNTEDGWEMDKFDQHVINSFKEKYVKT